MIVNNRDPSRGSEDLFASANKHPPNAPVVKQKRFPANLPDELGITLDQFGKAVAVIRNNGNPYVLAVGSSTLNNIIRTAAVEADTKLSRSALKEINDGLQASAELSGVTANVWRRVAPVDDGIEIDLGDSEHTRVRIVADSVDIVRSGSKALFFRPQHARPMASLAEKGDLRLLEKYVNLDPASFLLFTAWLTYTLALPKVPSSKYVILALQGGQGTGKSLLSRIVKDLVDPSVVGVQVLPSKIQDLSIAAQQAHVLCYDNLRQLSHTISDALCIAATGGSMSSRQLYSDAEQSTQQLHVALVLNGIHAFIDQPDLAQRCLPLYLKPLDANGRKSEAEMLNELAVDLPAIQRGLFDLIAKTFSHLPDANVTHPERMLDFCKWLAAMEMAEGIRGAVYQIQYSDALKQGQLDALLDNPLAATVLDFAEALDEDGWSGTPAKLLSELSDGLPRSTQRSRDWPDNPIALSKRLQSLQAGLLTQGVQVDFARGKERKITIQKGVAK